jgi:hypothetical protein
MSRLDQFVGQWAGGVAAAWLMTEGVRATAAARVTLRNPDTASWHAKTAG